MVNSNNISFTGYDARQLKGVLFRSGFPGDKKFVDFVNEVAGIVNRANVDVYVQSDKGIHKNGLTGLDQTMSLFSPYAQDRIVFLPNKKIMAEDLCPGNKGFDLLRSFFKLPFAETKTHIEGGNFFFVKDGQRDVVVIGKDEKYLKSQEELKSVFGNKALYFVSQPDYHIDLSIRPLNKKRILVHSPEMMLKAIEKGIQNAAEIYSKTKDAEIGEVLSKLKSLYQNTNLAQEQYNLKNKYNDLYKELRYSKGCKFEVIKVPGIVESPGLGYVPRSNSKDSIALLSGGNIKYHLNYINALAFEKPDGSLVYLANKSNLDEMLGITPEIEQKIGFSFEKMFRDSLKGIVKEEDIHFVGENNNFLQNLLQNNDAGIHCLLSEIPVYNNW